MGSDNKDLERAVYLDLEAGDECEEDSGIGVGVARPTSDLFNLEDPRDMAKFFTQLSAYETLGIANDKNPDTEQEEGEESDRPTSSSIIIVVEQNPEESLLQELRRVIARRLKGRLEGVIDSWREKTAGVRDAFNEAILHAVDLGKDFILDPLKLKKFNQNLPRYVRLDDKSLNGELEFYCLEKDLDGRIFFDKTVYVRYSEIVVRHPSLNGDQRNRVLGMLDRLFDRYNPAQEYDLTE